MPVSGNGHKIPGEDPGMKTGVLRYYTGDRSAQSSGSVNPFDSFYGNFG